jgi:signal peptidase II
MSNLEPSESPATSAAAPGRARLPLWGLYAIAVAVLALDQLTKAAVANTMAQGQEEPVLGRLLSLTHRHNTGGAFSLFPSGALPLTVIAAIVVVVLIVFSRQLVRLSLPLSLGIALHLGGAAGNLIDRARQGYVTDFIDFHFWPVFNIADIGITVGAALVVYALLFDPALRTAPARAER